MRGLAVCGAQQTCSMNPLYPPDGTIGGGGGGDCATTGMCMADKKRNSTAGTDIVPTLKAPAIGRKALTSHISCSAVPEICDICTMSLPQGCLLPQLCAEYLYRYCAVPGCSGPAKAAAHSCSQTCCYCCHFGQPLSDLLVTTRPNFIPALLHVEISICRQHCVKYSFVSRYPCRAVIR